MSIPTVHVGLYTDYYEFTMAQAYFLSGNASIPACFDYFFRENPYQGGYVVFAGLSDLLSLLREFHFDEEEIRYLREKGLHDRFLEYLKSFRFRGSIASVREGEVVFPLEPVVRVQGNIIEAQLIETVLLNLLNFESLIATKAARIRHIVGEKRVVDFGLRRAQGFGGIHASKAAMIGGLDATSNVFSAFHFALEVAGTQAHSWIQSFDDELTAFRKFAEVFPHRCILLVDTYDTLKSGVPKAIIVARELEAKGHRLAGIRLDSGDLAYLSKKARVMLDEAGLQYVRIVVSNQLDEFVIRSLVEQDAPIDAFGVGTRLVTGQPSAALDGVYKLSASAGKPRLKFSENFTKITLPGIKKILRYHDADGLFYADAIALENETRVEEIVHPFFPENKSVVGGRTVEEVSCTFMENGEVRPVQSVSEAATYARERMARLSVEHKRFENPHIYKVGISKRLMDLRSQLIQEFHKTLPGGGKS